MVGAGVLILTKQGDPVTTLITIATNLFGNVLFPPQVMPIQLQVISFFLPQYYFFTCIRPVLTGQPLQTILPDLFVLMLMCAIISAHRLLRLLLVPKNGEKTRNTLMVLRKGLCQEPKTKKEKKGRRALTCAFSRRALQQLQQQRQLPLKWLCMLTLGCHLLEASLRGLVFPRWSVRVLWERLSEELLGFESA